MNLVPGKIYNHLESWKFKREGWTLKKKNSVAARDLEEGQAIIAFISTLPCSVSNKSRVTNVFLSWKNFAEEKG